MKKKCFTPQDMGKLRYLSAVTVSRDGRRAVCVCSIGDEESGAFFSHLLLADLEAGTTAPLFPGENRIRFEQPQFDLDGALYYLSDRSGLSQLYRLQPETGTEVLLSTARHGITRYSLSADGRTAAIEMNLWPEEITAETAFSLMTDEERRAWEEDLEYRPYEITDLTYKMDEWHGMRHGEMPHIARIDLRTGSQTLLTPDGPEACWPCLSPDGERVAFYGYPHTGAFGRQPELFLCEKDGSGLRQLTDNQGVYVDGFPFFSPSGEELLFVSMPETADGSVILLPAAIHLENGEIRRLMEETEDAVCHGINPPVGNRTEYGTARRPFCLSGNGKALYFVSSFHGREQIYRKPLSRPEAPAVVAIPGETAIREFGLAEDGTLVYLMSSLKHPPELFVKRPGDSAAVQLTAENAWLNEYELPMTEEFWIPTRDGTSRLQVWLMHPAGQKPEEKYPAVLYVRGGPPATYNADYWHEFHALACAGMAVIYTNPRGSLGYGKAFCADSVAWKQEAMDDLLSAVDACVERGWIDPRRLGITGGSYGGYMTNKLIGRTKVFAAAASQRCLVNPATSYGTGDMGFVSAQPSGQGFSMLEYLEDRARGNPLTYIDNIKIPLLLLHGYQDYRCSFEQAEQMFIAMRDRNPEVPVRLVMFPGENHSVDRTGKLYHQIQHLEELCTWFQKYLGGEEHGNGKEIA